MTTLRGFATINYFADGKCAPPNRDGGVIILGIMYNKHYLSVLGEHVDV